MAIAATSPPESGQLVNVRSRRWVVNEVQASQLSPRLLEPTASKPQHLVSLLSVEDDALGEELRVVWEIEPGAKVIEKVALPEPTGFDSPDRLDAFLDAVRWGAASTADLRNIQAPFRSGIDIEDYQLTRWSGPSRCLGSTSWSPTTWAWARPSSLAWSPSS